MRDRFTIYRSTFDALKAYPPEHMKEAFLLIGKYALDGIEPDEEQSVAYGLFCSVKPLIDTSIKRSEAGKNGGETNKDEANPSKLQANVSKVEANLSKPEANCGNLQPKIKDKREKIKDNNKYILSSKRTAEYPYKEVVDYLNSKAGTKFLDESKDTRSHIKARFDEGFSLDDFKTVIDKKVAEWTGTEFAKFIRPSTLFGTKFESYLNEQLSKAKSENKFNNFTGRSYDFDSLEQQLMESQFGG